MSNSSYKADRPAPLVVALVFVMLGLAATLAVVWINAFVTSDPYLSALLWLPTETPAPSPTVTRRASIQVTATAHGITPAVTYTRRPTRTPRPTLTVPPPTSTALPTFTPSPLPATATPTSTSTRTPTATPMPVYSPTPEDTATPTASPTATELPSPTAVAANPERCMEDGGRVMPESFTSRVSGSEFRYLAYLPPCYELNETRYPVIYLLHGSDHDETHWESLGLFEVMDAGLRSGQFSPAILILADGDPDLFINTSGGLGSYEDQIVNELVPLVDKTFRTEPQPRMRAIGGISRGGVWSLEIGFRNPTLFWTVAGHSAALNVNEAPPELDPIQMAKLPSLKSQRIWLDAGDTDYCQPGAEDMDRALLMNEVPHIYHIWPGAHDDSLWAAHLTDYLEFYTQPWPK